MTRKYWETPILDPAGYNMTYNEGMDFPVNAPWTLGFWVRYGMLMPEPGVLLDTRDDCYMSGMNISVTYDASISLFITPTNWQTIYIDSYRRIDDGLWHLVVVEHGYGTGSSAGQQWYSLSVDRERPIEVRRTVDLGQTLVYGRYWGAWFDGNYGDITGYARGVGFDGIFWLPYAFWGSGKEDLFFNNGHGIQFEDADFSGGGVYSNCEGLFAYAVGTSDTMFRNANGPVTIMGTSFNMMLPDNGIGLYGRPATITHTQRLVISGGNGPQCLGSLFKQG
jgi:hypothetical protein